MARALTPRQLDCLRLAAGGYSNQQTATRLRIGLYAVRFHLTQARKRLGARNTSHACALAVHYRIVTAEHLGLKEDA